MSLGHARTAGLRSDQGFRFQLSESLDTIEYINREQRPGLDHAHAQDDENPHILRMLECTLLLGTARLNRIMAKYIRSVYEICVPLRLWRRYAS